MWAMSAPVQAAMTPVVASAAEVSIATIRPCAWAERTTRICSCCANEISSAKRPWPVSKGGSSSRVTGRPTKGRSPDMSPGMPLSPSLAAASFPIVLRFYRFEMSRVVDAPHADAAPGHVNFVDTARILGRAPVGGQRLVEKLQQHGAVHAVMADQRDGLIGMARK